MIARAARYLSTVPPVFLDGCLFGALAWFVFSQAYFGGDEASKFLDPKVKFWLNWIVGSGATLCGAIKMFRSRAYADHQDQKIADATGKPVVVTPMPTENPEPKTKL